MFFSIINTKNYTRDKKLGKVWKKVVRDFGTSGLWDFGTFGIFYKTVEIILKNVPFVHKIVQIILKNILDI